MQPNPNRFANPYLIGIALGLVLVASYVFAGHGLGASGGAFRFAAAFVAALAPTHAATNPIFSPTLAGSGPLDNSYVFMVVGVFLGGLVSSYAAGRFKVQVMRGPRISPSGRLFFAVLGGVLMGYAARLTRGCASGQGLTGGALMSVGAWIFMLAFFAGGYAVAYFIRREWI